MGALPGGRSLHHGCRRAALYLFGVSYQHVCTLREMGLAEYEPYQGASLTEAGCVEALRLLRRHRLIQTFLLECLGYSWEEVHEEAERLEHSVSDGFTERLAESLGHPAHDPHGDPIPAADGSLEADDSFPSWQRQPVSVSASTE